MTLFNNIHKGKLTTILDEINSNFFNLKQEIHIKNQLLIEFNKNQYKH